MTERHKHAARQRVGLVGGQIITRRVRSASANVDVRQLARLRHVAYRLLSVALLYPQDPVIAAAAYAASHLRRTSSWSVRLAIYTPLNRFLQHAAALGLSSLRALQQEYIALFGSSLMLQPVPLCESAYLDSESMALPRVIADLEQQYALAGLSASREGAVPADHAAVELEFISFLCKKELGAWAAKDLHSALEAIDRQRSFIEKHPSRWVPLLASAIARRAPGNFYALTAEAASALLLHDGALLEALLEYLDKDRGPVVEGGKP